MKLEEKIAAKITRELNLDQTEYEVLKYGAFALIFTFLSILAVALVGLLFGVMKEALIVSFSTSILRQYSGGAHANRPISCLVIGTGVSVLIAYIINYLSIFTYFEYSVFLIFIIFLIAYYLVHTYAPVDSKSKPIRREEKKKRMKRLSIVILTIYLNIIVLLIIAYLKSGDINFLKFSLDISGGIAFQVFSLSIVGRKILGKIDIIITKVIYRGVYK